MNAKKLADNMSLIVGAIATALLLGALGFQYIGRLAPCDICIWQRWPLLGAAIIGLIGGLATRNQSSLIRQAVTTATILLVAISGAIAVYHVGVEWKWWEGPSHCTGFFVIGAPVDPNAYKIVPCDKPTFIFGTPLSMATYNALISLGSAITASIIVRLAKKA